LLGIARELVPLTSSASVAEHLGVLIAFLIHESTTVPDDLLRATPRARSAILATLRALRTARTAIRSGSDRRG
jgi:hypothetical protein